MPNPRHRAFILKAFNKYGLKTVRPDSLAFLQDLIERHDIDEDQIQSSMELLAKAYLLEEDSTGFVSKVVLEKVYESMQDAPETSLNIDSSVDVDHHLFFIDAFEMPWWQYSLERQTFEKSSCRPTISGSPESRSRMHRDRLQIIKRIILRNEHFAPAAFQHRDRQAALKLRSTKDLLGRAGENEAFMLFGMLAYSPQGKLCLEDLDGRVELDLSHVEPSEGLYSEGCVVMVEGVYTDEEVLALHALGHPPCERRTRARAIDGHFDFLGQGATTLLEDAKWGARMHEFPDLVFLAISDLWLDHPKTLVGFRKLLEMAIAEAFLPKVFILCGNFTSRAVQGSGKDLQRYQDGFDDLADLIASYPAFRSSHFVFVPGPLDLCGSSVLPRPPLLAPLVRRLKTRVANTHFMSNPCRIKLFAQEIAIMREDLMSKMLRNVITLKPGASDDDLKKFLFQTVLDQCHLCPLPQNVQLVLSEFDHSMRLYPLPTVLILADKSQRYEDDYEGCHVFNPGSFIGNSFGFSTYFPATGNTDSSELGMEE